MSDYRFQVHLGGMIEVLSDHLYSSPDVYIRELLQNAVDAIVARKKHNGADSDYKGNIYVYLEGNTLRFVDNGIGIKNENLTNIFKKGFREEKNGDVVGHGYGLSNVREIVSKNGGIIYLESEPGKGSKFTIKLRLSD